MNILFVCMGNVSRSFLAEMLLKKELGHSNKGKFSISSAGLSAFPGSPPDVQMVSYLKKMGLFTEGHRSSQITKEEVDWADLILVMEKYHVSKLQNQWPEAKGKVELLSKYLRGGQFADDIPDPFGRSPYHYRLSQSQITLAIKSLAKKLISNSPKD
ncbi:MAG: low molecular weight protein arginine phosphatase [Desulfobacteraceae bacterium]|nr:low molecular weight protein arginine phosphatase [Desulfobacteraceae bacterium]